MGTAMLITKEFLFDAAHNLPNYHGKCERLHGHTFKVHVTVRAEINPADGIAFDFGRLKSIVNQRVIDLVDHTYLNDILEHPSAENLCVFVWEKLADLPLWEIKVWESPTSFATLRADLNRELTNRLGAAATNGVAGIGAAGGGPVNGAPVNGVPVNGAVVVASRHADA